MRTPRGCNVAVLAMLLPLSGFGGAPGLAEAQRAEASPKAVLPDTTYRFGRVLRGTVIEHDFVLSNAGTGTLQVQRARMTPPLVATRLPARIAPGEEGVLRFALRTADLEGPFEGRIQLELSDPDLPEAILEFEGVVVPPIELSPMPAFFVAARRGEPKQASIEIINHEPAPLHVEKVEHPAGRFTTELEALEEGRRYRLTLWLNPEGPVGKTREIIRVTTSSMSRPLLEIPANTYLHERVYTFPDAVDLGAVRLADLRKDPELARTTVQTLMVYQSGGTDFRVEARTDLSELAIESERGPLGDRYQFTLKLAPEKMTVGPLRGSIFLTTNDPEFPELTVAVSGFILEP